MGLSSNASPAWVRRQVLLSGGLLLLVFVLGNRLAQENLRWRKDLSADGLREWAPVTSAILDRLEDPLQIELFFPEQTQLGWVQIAKRTNLELLSELEGRSTQPIDLVRSDTNRADVSLRAQEYGIPAITEGGLSGTSTVVESITLGAVLRYRGRERVIPRLLPGALEYTVLDAIHGLTRVRKPRVGVLQTALAAPVMATLLRTGRYDVEAASGLEEGLALPGDLDLLIAPGPIELGARSREVLREYVEAGGRLLVYADRSRSQLENADLVSRDSGLETLLAEWGLPLSKGIVWDLPMGTPLRLRREGFVTYPAWLTAIRSGDPGEIAERFAEENPLGGTLSGLHARFAHEIDAAEVPEGCERVNLVLSSADAYLYQPTGKMVLDAEGVALEHDRLLVTADPARRALIASVRGPLGGPEAPEAFVLLVSDDDGLGLLDANLSGAEREFQALNRDTLLNLVDGATAGDELLALRRRRPTERRLRDFLAEERESLGLDDRNLEAGAQLLQLRQQSADEALAAERASARRLRWTGLTTALSFLGVLALVGWAQVQRRAPLLVESGEDPARDGVAPTGAVAQGAAASGSAASGASADGANSKGADSSRSVSP